MILATLSVLSGDVTASLSSQQESGSAPIKVVATLPFLKDFVDQVGQDRVRVKSLLSGFESEHTYSPRPTDILAVREADLLVKLGLGLDVWTDSLIVNAQNPRLSVITTSTGVPLLKGSPHADSSDELAPKNRNFGNPHIWLDPENAKTMIRHVTEGLIRLDPRSKPFYLQNQAAYFRKLDELQKILRAKTRVLENRKIITHHDAWPYFARRFGFAIRASIFTQVGTEPSALKMAKLVRLIKREKIKVIVSEPQLNPRLPEILAEETGARVVVLTPLPGTLPGTESYYAMIKYDAETLIAALSEP